MAKVKKSSSATDIKKKGFGKNSSFSGVELKKSPKSRRKSIATFSRPENLNESVKEKKKGKTEKVKHVPLILAPTEPSKKAHKHVPLVLAPKPEVSSAKTPKKNKTKKTKESGSTKVMGKDYSKYEEEFKIKSADVSNAIEGILKFASESPKFKNQLFNEQFPLMLQVNSIKVPKGHKKILRIPLKNSILTQDDDVCLIVPDVKGIPNKEHERHVEHYEKLLAEKNVTGIKKIMTFHEFRTEYETFELKNRLVDLYEAFLVDGKISGKVVQKGGKLFYKKRKLPTPIKLHVTKLKEHIESSLNKAFFDLHLKSNSYTVQFGHSNMKTEELIENVYSIAQFLKANFPGGLENIQNMSIMSAKTIAVPIYVSLINPNEVEVPKVTSKKPKAYKTYKGELTTQLSAKVTVRPTGEITVKRKKRFSKKDSPNAENNDEITDQDIIKDHEEEQKKIKTEAKEAKNRKRKQESEDNTVKEEGAKQKKVKKEKPVVVKTEDNKAKIKTEKIKKNKIPIKSEKAAKVVKKVKSKSK